ncbi:hypothetical protein Snoj_20400 [Streptomyces nojiriensis]|uniref:Uncharacterized protein n=1 Tax=Streptomyces nojiriensis TaxID=66374 RepID=A0ABQ3SJD2_9ACTN|nr:hypothetical protein GCM10010205_57180 [Streptomyces nojiriensis]GHI68122.1 hypothetical protein Snoj_20400 [Streptomyces nojiriensis]
MAVIGKYAESYWRDTWLPGLTTDGAAAAVRVAAGPAELCGAATDGPTDAARTAVRPTASAASLRGVRVDVLNGTSELVGRERRPGTGPGDRHRPWWVCMFEVRGASES